MGLQSRHWIPPRAGIGGQNQWFKSFHKQTLRQDRIHLQETDRLLAWLIGFPSPSQSGSVWSIALLLSAGQLSPGQYQHHN